MKRSALSGARRRQVPEVLQSALTDCGPAALKAVLEGFGISISYDTVRERCQTDVDGTSIDALARLSRELGLDSEQILVPHDHFVLPEARCLPAIVVTRSGGGLLHFVVVWRRVWGFLEVMDPSGGRRWLSARRLLARMPSLPIAVSGARFRRWAASEDARRPWRARLRALGVPACRARALLEQAGRDPSWLGFARFDAAVRMLTELCEGGAFRRGREATRLIERLAPVTSPIGIPERFRWVRSAPDGSDRLVAYGSVILRFKRRSGGAERASGEPPCAATRSPAADPRCVAGTSSRGVAPAARVRLGGLPASAVERLAAPTLRPSGVLWAVLRARAQVPMLWLLLGVALSAALVPGEALLLRALLDIGRHYTLGYQQVSWLLALLVLVGAALWLDVWSQSLCARLGRSLEATVRAALLERLPWLDDHYLRSRSSSDMASRGHSLHLLRGLPGLWAQMARACCSTLALTGTLVWLYPEGWPWACALALSALVLPFAGRRALSETSLRLHTQSAALDRFYLDTLLGAAPVRVHGAERSIQHAHEQLLVEWAATARRLHAGHTLVQGLQMLGTGAFAVALLLVYLSQSGEASRLLLLAFLALRLPLAAGELTGAQLACSNLGSVARRALAPLAAPLEREPTSAACEAPVAAAAAVSAAPGAPAVPGAAVPGVALSFGNVSVLAGGHELLRGIELEVEPGRHVGIVGASGAGKSSLLGLLLGWHVAAEGTVRVDGQALDAPSVRRLREETAWVDPAVQLWERSLIDNLAYGDDEHLAEALPAALSRADLLDVLERLPEGLQTNLGEGGTRISGGQGQRVRLGRAFLRAAPRLVLLDEPFRGLERDRRRELLRRARRHWRGATLLFVSHDVDDTNELDQVVVLEAGQIVESGAPAVLLADPSSRYARLSESARALRRDLWRSAAWRELDVKDGRLQRSETLRAAAHEHHDRIEREERDDRSDRSDRSDREERAGRAEVTS